MNKLEYLNDFVCRVERYLRSQKNTNKEISEYIDKINEKLETTSKEDTNKLTWIDYNEND